MPVDRNYPTASILRVADRSGGRAWSPSTGQAETDTGKRADTGKQGKRDVYSVLGTRSLVPEFIGLYSDAVYE